MPGRLHDIARRLDRRLLPVMGPAQLGAGHAEAPYTPPVDAVCPMCGRAMADHVVVRSPDPARATRMHCPTIDHAAR